uniref:Uncharacterized protein n=1 Tax=Anguilla anguilla TaxID=7936 RepID=A0A0E9QGV7_ANGAN
MTTVTLNLG